MPRSYPPEFRRKVLALVEAGRPIKQVAKMLGISGQTIYKLAQTAPDRHRPGARHFLRRERRTDRCTPAIAQLEQELAIHRRAAELLDAVVPPIDGSRPRVHKTANILDALPKSAQPAAKTALSEIWDAEDIDYARTALATFTKQYIAKFPKAVAKPTDDERELPVFYEYPAERWIPLCTTNPIESTFSTVRLRAKVTRGAGSRAAALAMSTKLIEFAQERSRAVNAPRLVALVRTGACFERGVPVEREAAAA